MAMLTRASWVKIILIGLFCLVLCCGIVGCSMGCSSLFGRVGALASGTYESVSFEEKGDFSVRGQDVDSIEILWLAGGVDLVIEEPPIGKDAVYDEKDKLPITGVEETVGGLRDSERMTWQLRNGVLQISYGPVRWGLNSCSSPTKRLVLTVPKSVAMRGFGSVSLKGTSGEYNLGEFDCQNLDIDLASGLVQGDGVDAKSLDLDVASGTVNLRGEFLNSVNVSLASGLISVASLSACPAYSSIDVMSGQATLAIPDDSGFTAKVDKLSGSFNCEFMGAWDAQTDGLLICGDGEKRMDISMASGTVNLCTSE